MDPIDPLTVDQNTTLQSDIEAGRHARVRTTLEGKYKSPKVPFTPAQVNSPRFPGNTRMIDLAIKHATGKNGASVIKNIIAHNPDISAKILLMPESRLMHIDAVQAIITYPALKINDMTDKEKGQVLLFLTLIRQNKTETSDYIHSDIFENAIILAGKLLESGGIEQKYKNMVL